MEALAPVIEWFRENEAALSGLAAMAMLIGLLLSPLGRRTRTLLGRSEAPAEAKPVVGSLPASPGPRTEKASLSRSRSSCAPGTRRPTPWEPPCARPRSVPRPT